jgi:nucleoside-diphosphate-sugar epimerase
MRRAFVAGATGYTGREVVRALRERGIETVAHVRPDSSQLPAWREQLSALGATVDTTPWEPAAMAEAMRRHAPDVVFALLGTTRARMRRDGADNSYERVDYGLTALLVDAAAASGRPLLVYLSAAGVREGGNAYYEARWKAEQHLQKSGLPWLIARPSFITGADRDEPRPMERLGAAVTDGALAMAGLFGGRRLRDRYRSTDARELGQALVRLALDPRAAGRIVHSEELRAAAG